MFVDPSVSRAKFEREILSWRKLETYYRRRGIFVIDVAFPQVFAIFLAVNAKPAPMLPFGAIIDFSNYDVEPPSVQLVNPFTQAKLTRQEIGYEFLRQLPTNASQPPTSPPPFMPLLQAFVNERPFICLQGIREYHDSPAHSGDNWLLHRGTGVGTLGFLLDVLSKYGAEPIRGPGLNVNLTVNGFAIQAVPQ